MFQKLVAKIAFRNPRSTENSSESGQGLAEVAIILTLVVVVAILALTELGDSIVTTLETVAATI